jgi:hypothetical protein
MHDFDGMPLNHYFAALLNDTGLVYGHAWA